MQIHISEQIFSFLTQWTTLLLLHAFFAVVLVVFVVFIVVFAVVIVIIIVLQIANSVQDIYSHLSVKISFLTQQSLYSSNMYFVLHLASVPRT
jgi:hypothetical protein